MIQFSSTNSGTARSVRIFGIGGAGANAIDRLALDGVSPSCLVAANTDAQVLTASVAGNKIQLGKAATRGLGSGGDPELGRCAAEEAASEIRAAVEGEDVIFIVAGLGGGTGSGAAPYVAEIARDAGAMVIAVVTLPFSFEKRRAAQAAEALVALQQHADAVVCFENDRMGETAPPRAGMQTAFTAANQTISQSVCALASLINRTGLIRLGFDELSVVLQDVNSRCVFGFGQAEGSNRSFDALAQALKNPLMDKGRMLRDCATALVQVSGGPDMTLDEVHLLMEEFNRFIGDRANILFGAAVDPALAGRMHVTILGSIGEAQPKAVTPRHERVTAPLPASSGSQRARESFVQKTTPAPEPKSAVQTETKPPAPDDAGGVVIISDEDEDFTLDAELPETIVQEEPPADPEPAPPLVEKPRGLRTATFQGSLFGEESSAPAEKVTPPVPGRMLRRPFPERPPSTTPTPEPTKPVAVPTVATAPAAASPLPTASKPTARPEPVEPPEAAEQRTEVEAEQIPEAEPVYSPEPEPLPEPETPVQAIPQPQPKVDRSPLSPRRPGYTQPPRTPELIPTEEYGSAPAKKTPQQEVMQFEPVTRGRFEKSEPTIVDGQDLDVPTYLRRRIKLR